MWRTVQHAHDAFFTYCGCTCPYVTITTWSPRDAQQHFCALIIRYGVCLNRATQTDNPVRHTGRCAVTYAPFTDSLVQGPSREARQEIICILWNPKVHYRVHNSPNRARLMRPNSNPISWRCVLIISSHPQFSFSKMLITINSLYFHFYKVDKVYRSKWQWELPMYRVCVLHFVTHANFTNIWTFSHFQWILYPSLFCDFVLHSVYKAWT
jgi:hypothetical protein